jgi:hypothetical protein
MPQALGQRFNSENQRRSVRRHAVNAGLGVALCYFVLFGVASLDTGRDVSLETDPLQTASAERLPNQLLGAHPQDRRLDALASMASQQRLLDQKLAEQARVFEEQRLRAGRYEQALQAARRDVDALNLGALNAAEAHSSSLEASKRALAIERRKVQTLERRAQADERDRARLAHERLIAVQERDAVREGSTRAEMALQRASQHYVALERVHERMRHDWEQATRTAAADRMALDEARERTAMLARDFSAAVDEIRRIKLREALRYVRAQRPSLAAAPTKTIKRRAAKQESKPKPMKVVSRKTQQPTVFLPESLLPTRPPLRK